MSLQTFEVQAHSLEAAREDLQKKMSPGTVVIQETVLADGSSTKVEAEGATVDEAIQVAKGTVPPAAVIESQEVVRQPTEENAPVTAFDESEARKKASVTTPKRIASVSMKERGRRGFLGIGRRPNTYEVRITQPALVQITYREPRRIRAEVGTPEQRKQRKLVEVAEKYIAMDHPRGGVIGHILQRFGAQSSTKPIYCVNDEGHVQRGSYGMLGPDALIVSVASCLPRKNVSGVEELGRSAFQAVIHYANLPKVQQFFMASNPKGSDDLPLQATEECRLYAGVENLLVQIYHELPYGGLLTDLAVESKIDTLIARVESAN